MVVVDDEDELAPLWVGAVRLLSNLLLVKQAISDLFPRLEKVAWVSMAIYFGRLQKA